MSKAKRAGKVFVDWSQNDRHKTTVNVYSLRAMERPTVSTPLTWDEVVRLADADEPLSFTSDRGAGAGGLAGRSVRAGADAGAGTSALEQRAPVVGRQPGRLGARAEVREDVGEALRIVVVGHVAGAVEDLEAARRASPRAPLGRAMAGMIESRSPHTISVGRTAARCSRSRALTRWPEASITERTVCRNAWREPLLFSDAKPRASTARSPSGATRPSRSALATPRPMPWTPDEVSTGSTQSAPGQRGGAQQQVDLVAEPAAGDEPEPLAALGELVGELHRDAAAERVADDRDVVVAERGQEVADAAGVGAERVVAAGRGRVRRGRAGRAR